MLTLTGYSRRRIPTSPRLAAAVFAIVVGGVAASVTTTLLPRGASIATGGPQAVHLQKSGDTLVNELQGSSGPPAGPLTVPAGGRATVPILLYHYIRTVDRHSDLLGYNLSIDPKLFAQQMALLRVEGATPITLETLMSALNGGTGLPPHPVVLTFDDGYADFATAAEPILNHFHFVGTNYVVSGFIGRPNYMTSEQVKHMDVAGMVIGAHTAHHVDLTHAGNASEEISGSKATLEKLLGHPVLDFAYPYGFFNAGIEAMTEQAGYREATATTYGDTQSLTGRYSLPRLRVGGAPSLGTFAHTAGLPSPTAAQRSAIQALAQNDYQAPADSDAPGSTAAPAGSPQQLDATPPPGYPSPGDGSAPPPASSAPAGQPPAATQPPPPPPPTDPPNSTPAPTAPAATPGPTPTPCILPPALC